MLHSSDQTLSAQMQSLIKLLAFPDAIKLRLRRGYIPIRNSDYWQSMSAAVTLGGAVLLIQLFGSTTFLVFFQLLNKALPLLLLSLEY